MVTSIRAKLRDVGISAKLRGENCRPPPEVLSFSAVGTAPNRRRIEPFCDRTKFDSNRLHCREGRAPSIDQGVSHYSLYNMNNVKSTINSGQATYPVNPINTRGVADTQCGSCGHITHSKFVENEKKMYAKIMMPGHYRAIGARGDGVIQKFRLVFGMLSFSIYVGPVSRNMQQRRGPRQPSVIMVSLCHM
jgi:hypothetical protein